MPKKAHYNKRCGEPLDDVGTTCQTPIPSELHRCRHHSRTPQQKAYIVAKNRETFRLAAQRDESKARRGRFADLAFEHGLTDPRTIDAFAAWKKAVEMEGSLALPRSALPDGVELKNTETY